jgi:hypothetical protein
MDLFLIKTERGLLPYGDMDEMQYNKIPLGETRKFKCTKPRDLWKHRKFFALLSFTIDHMPEHLEDFYPNTEKLRKAIAIEMGHCEESVLFDGTIYREAKSISFASMDNDAFNDFYQKAIDIILKYILKGVEQDVLEEMIGFV